MRVRALSKGFAGGSLRARGAVFDWPGEGDLPGWVEPCEGPEPAVPKPAGAAGRDRSTVSAETAEAEIGRGLDALDPEDDSHWTQKGLPALAALAAHLAAPVSRAEVHVARPGFDREAARQALTAGLVRTVRQRLTVRRPD